VRSLRLDPVISTVWSGASRALPGAPCRRATCGSVRPQSATWYDPHSGICPDPPIPVAWSGACRALPGAPGRRATSGSGCSYSAIGYILHCAICSDLLMSVVLSGALSGPARGPLQEGYPWQWAPPFRQYLVHPTPRHLGRACAARRPRVKEGAGGQ